MTIDLLDLGVGHDRYNPFNDGLQKQLELEAARAAERAAAQQTVSTVAKRVPATKKTVRRVSTTHLTHSVLSSAQAASLRSQIAVDVPSEAPKPKRPSKTKEQWQAEAIRELASILNSELAREAQERGWTSKCRFQVAEYASALLGIGEVQLPHLGKELIEIVGLALAASILKYRAKIARNKATGRDNLPADDADREIRLVGQNQDWYQELLAQAKKSK